MVLKVNPLTGRFVPHCCCTDCTAVDCDGVRAFSCITAKIEDVKLAQCFAPFAEESGTETVPLALSSPDGSGWPYSSNALAPDTYLVQYAHVRRVAGEYPEVCVYSRSRFGVGAINYKVGQCDCGHFFGNFEAFAPYCSRDLFNTWYSDGEWNRGAFALAFIGLTTFVRDGRVEVVLSGLLRWYAVFTSNVQVGLIETNLINPWGKDEDGECQGDGSMYVELFRGSAELPTDWIDTSGNATYELEVTNGYTESSLGNKIGGLVQSAVLGAGGKITLGVDPTAVEGFEDWSESDPDTWGSFTPEVFEDDVQPVDSEWICEAGTTPPSPPGPPPPRKPLPPRPRPRIDDSIGFFSTTPCCPSDGASGPPIVDMVDTLATGVRIDGKCYRLNRPPTVVPILDVLDILLGTDAEPIYLGDPCEDEGCDCGCECGTCTFSEDSSVTFTYKVKVFTAGTLAGDAPLEFLACDGDAVVWQGGATLRSAGGIVPPTPCPPDGTGDVDLTYSTFQVRYVCSANKWQYRTSSSGTWQDLPVGATHDCEGASYEFDICPDQYESYEIVVND